MIGQTLGHYRVLEKIGEGGMGVVYRARDERLERDVALKVLPGDALSDDAARRQFRKEALALARLNHPNIGAVYDFDCQDGIDFLVMEYVPGSTVGEKVVAGISEKEVLQLGRQLAAGLAAAHEQGIVHRDLKPANLRVTPGGLLKILDFGLAKLLHRDPGADATVSATQDGAVAGTLPYMAPEQLRGDALDARTDIYAAGAVLFEMATGQRPFSQSIHARLVDEILHQPPPSLRALNSRVSPVLESIVLKALDKDPDRRYQSAKEMRVDLDRLAVPSSMSVPVSLPRTNVASRVWQTARLHPRLSSVSALAAFGTLALLWWLVAARPVLSFAPRDFILVTDFDNQTGDPLFDRSLLTALEVSLEQSAHANVFPPGRMAESLRRMGKKGSEKIDEGTGREICLRENLRALLSPATSRVGQQYAISARLINPQTGAAARSYYEIAKDQDHVLDAVGRMATKIRRNLGEPLLATWKGDRPLPQVTTASLQALKLYADGLDFWMKGQYDAGVRAWRSALEADPDFAMAHAAVGNAMYSFVYNNPVDGKVHYDKALQLSERTTERERLFIQAKYADALNHFSDAAQLFELYLKSYPDDWRVRSSLADLYRTNDRPQEAIAQFKEVLRLSPSSAGAYINRATCYDALGQFAEALRDWEEAFKLEPPWITNGNLNHEYGITLIQAGNEAKAREVFEKALASPDLRPRGLRSFAYVDLLHGRYREAKPRLQEALLLDTVRKATLSELREHGLLAMVEEGLGNRASRIHELDLALPLLFTLPDKGRPALWLGVAYARSGVVAKAAQILEVVKPHADVNNPVQASDVHLLEGEVELARGNKDHALELLLLADREKSSGLTLASLARAYLLTGDTELAIRWNETFLDKKPSPIGWEPQQDWIAAHVNLARLYLARGEKEKAAARLNEFFALWKDADPDIPILIAAKTDYAKLK